MGRWEPGDMGGGCWLTFKMSRRPGFRAHDPSRQPTPREVSQGALGLRTGPRVRGGQVVICVPQRGYRIRSWGQVKGGPGAPWWGWEQGSKGLVI